jgi:hypothetical protein
MLNRFVLGLMLLKLGMLTSEVLALSATEIELNSYLN